MANVENVQLLVRKPPVIQRREVIAKCSDKASTFGAEFFADVLVKNSDSICRWYTIRALGMN